jgi:cold shock CspA family protein
VLRCVAGPMEMTDRRLSGTVVWFNDELRYGFIKSDAGTKYFAHSADLVGRRYLVGGERVTFTGVEDKRKRGPRALDVLVLGFREVNQ